MKSKTVMKLVAMILSIAMCCPVLAGVCGMAYAADVTGNVYLTAFPRAGDDHLDYSGIWGHDDLTFKNGWHAGKAIFTTVRTVGAQNGNVCYCIEPGADLGVGDTLIRKGEDFWINYPSDYNDVIEPVEIKQFIGRIFQYGYTGNVDDSWRSQNEGADKLANVVATQLLVWETVVGERDSEFNHVSSGGYSAVLDTVSPAHPLRAKILAHYSRIETSVKNHTVVPSFCSRSQGKAGTVDLTWDGSKYVAKLTDSKNVLNSYSFSADVSGVSFSVSGNQLTVTVKNAPDKDILITADKKTSKRRGVITWSDGTVGFANGTQDLATFAEEVSDPVKGYVKLKVSQGSAKLIKKSEDGKVSGIRFTVKGNGYEKTFVTDSSGTFVADNLNPGEYTVTEQSYDNYEPQQSQTVTVVSGQTATVTFQNKLKRGNLKVTKTAEDGLVSGVRFHLYGTSGSGTPVDEYAVTDSSGIATFSNILIGTGYMLEEVGTPDRYVVPTKQTAAVEWNKVTNKSVDNVLKKWSLTVTKVDGENGTAQGDASLAGARYGVFKGDELVDTYVTDADGKFTTKEYVCGNDWSIKELESSEGYLVTSGSVRIGVAPGNYSAEYNSEAMTQYEQVKKGNIAIIKHTDDGETQIETPEVGAEFAVYLKSAGSYDNAKDSERDYLICDENGFAQTKDLPYGRYTVQQIKGLEGRELLGPFDVFVSEDGEIYRYLINNANFFSYVKVVKVDSTTGKTIPCSGIGFNIYDPSGNKVEMTFTYPTVTTIDTFYTGGDGMLITPEKLEYGKGYSLVEVSAPYGYVLDSDPVYFDITEENSTEESAVTVVVVTKENSPQMGVITVEKTGEYFASVMDAENSTRPVYATSGMAGAEYTVTAAEDIFTPDGTQRYAKDEIVATLVTGSDGKAATEPLFLGRFNVAETKAPYGMTLDPAVRTVELTYAGQEVDITGTSVGFFNERQKIVIDLHKVMEQNSVFGVGFGGETTSVNFGLFADEDIVAADGSSIPAGRMLEAVSCDENGYAAFSTDLPVGAKIYVREIGADCHYVLSDREYPVVFEYEGQEVATVHITVNDGEDIANRLIYGVVKGYKVDRETGARIPGALFGLFRADETDFTEGNALLTAESDSDGVFSFENVVYGNYVVYELRPAEGYLENETVYPVTVTENGDVIEITAVNDLIPEINTAASVDGEKEVCATEVFTLTDTVEYSHLVPGREYTVKGILMDKATGEPFLQNGEQITSEVTFVPEAPSGSVEVLFTFDAKLIKTDTSIVVFESLYSDSKELTVHADIEDEDQTVTVVVPEIRTEASADGRKETTVGGDIAIEDTVSYRNITPNREYVIRGTLMNKATGEPITANGEPVVAETAFTPESRNGEIMVKFTFDSHVITEKTDVVVFEALWLEDVEIAVHANIGDEGQTVIVYVPEIKTTASIDGEKEVTTAGKVTVEDVVSYRDLIPGTKYTLHGILMNKATGEEFTVNGEKIVAEVSFTPEHRNGEVKVTFTFDTHGLTTSTMLVVFEKLYRDDVEITAHADIDDEDQTVTVTPPPEVPQTGDNSKLGLWIGLGAVAVGGAIACVIMYFRKKDDDETQ
ncbi:MAG: VaFE repeat-containing surface-anchored protein [Clostridia bacterium]|nr:VaFE repeat-containing surface-anchored protein [Clostridia bacterium]